MRLNDVVGVEGMCGVDEGGVQLLGAVEVKRGKEVSNVSDVSRPVLGGYRDASASMSRRRRRREGIMEAESDVVREERWDRGTLDLRRDETTREDVIQCAAVSVWRQQHPSESADSVECTGEDDPHYHYPPRQDAGH